MSNGAQPAESRIVSEGAATVDERARELAENTLKNLKAAPPDQAGQTTLKQQVETLFQLILEGTVRVSKNLVADLDAAIARLDEAISRQLNEILHHPDFQKLEASWRGLKYLVANSETSPMLKIRALNTSKDELLADFEEWSGAYDQTVLFKKVYEDEYDTPGGGPFGVLIGDYEFSRHPQDIDLLKHISKVAAAAHAPFLAAANPKMFGWDNFNAMTKYSNLADIFDPAVNPEYAKWTSFRESEESRYVALTLPHVLARLPYGPDTTPVAAFTFKEDVDGSDARKYLWSNAAYALGTRIAASFAKYGWCSAIRGKEGGGVVKGLPTHTFPTDDGGIAMKCPTEISLSQTREGKLSQLGFLPIVHYKNTDYAVFVGGNTCQKPNQYDKAEATASAELSARLPYVLAVSRFAHYLKHIVYDKIGSFKEREDLQQYLTDWINQYVTDDDRASFEEKAQRPLRAARVEVTSVAGKPGFYQAVAYLRPHFQLEGLNTDLKLVAQLPASKQ